MKTFNLLMLALTAISALPQMASAKDLTGTYEKRAGVRLFGTKEFCDGSQGEYVAEEKACYIYTEDGNSITIGEKLLHVETLFGAAHMRSFDGVILDTTGNTVTAKEALIEDGNVLGEVKDGCLMKVEVSEDGLATTVLGEECDGGLTIVNAKRR